LLGLVKEGEGMAYRVLLNLGLDLGKLRNEVMELLGSGIPGYGQQQETAKTGKTTGDRCYGRNLNKLAKDGKLDPVIGRKNELNGWCKSFPAVLKIILCCWQAVFGKTLSSRDWPSKS